ncbi:MAG TPA: hypothetical protein VNN72_17305, partial [Polyangiaceae bacterium]|nr:hypothetical protein [Polyangiaceae bacterium]
MRSTLVWGPLVLLLACGASHHGSGAGDGKHATSGGDAGSGGDGPSTTPGLAGSANRAGSGGNGGASGKGGSTAAGHAGGGGTANGGAGGALGMPSAGSGGSVRAGAGGDAARGGSSGEMTAGMTGAAGTVDGNTRLTELHGVDLFPSATVYAISADGTYVSGSVTNGNNLRAIRWEDDVGTMLETPSEWFYVYGAAISDDGSVIAGFGEGYDTIPFTWDGTSVHPLPGLDPAPGAQTLASATAISGDGRVLVGSATPSSGGQKAVRWVDGGIEELPLPEGSLGAGATSINHDGSVIVGVGGSSVATGVRWTKDGTDSYGMGSVAVWDVSDDGRFIVGSEKTTDLQTFATFTRAVRYGPNGAEYMPAPDGESSDCEALGVSGDGAIVFGR